jgi:dihydrolipoamide dehydrogenase
MAEAQRYDVVVLGAGPPGENVADRVVRGGLTCAVVEAELVGGECSYWACMPSKALLRPVELRAAATRVPGLPVGPLDPAAVLSRRDQFTSHHDDAGQVRWLAGVPADLVRGHGRLTGVREVTVSLPDGGTRVLTAAHAVVLATGTSAAVPEVPGLADARPWTSRELTSVREVPDRLVLVGGGVVAVEMAQAYAGLGSAVTLLVRGSRLLTGLEPFAGELVLAGLRDAGVDVRLGRQLARVSGSDGGVSVTLDDGAEVTADVLGVAVGRRPRTDDLGVDVVGLTPGRYVPVDDALAVTGVDGGWLYAVGDVNGRNLLTHMGKYQARICGDVIVARAGRQVPGAPAGAPGDGPRAYADGLGAPQVVFTDPQVAAVGLTEAAARARGHAVSAVEYDLGQVAGASLLADGYTGRAKLVLDADRGTVLGVTFAGQEVAELVQAGTVAVVAGLTVEQLWHAVPAYPTVSEIWLRLLEATGR